MTIPHPTYHTVSKCYPLALLAAVVSLFWMERQQQQVSAEYAGLRVLLTGLFHSTHDQVQQAYAAGDFEGVVNVLDSARGSVTNDPQLLLLRARALECLGRFREAIPVYARLEVLPGKHLAVVRGLQFCKRMAAEHTATGAPTREMFYQVQEELLRRGDAASARFVSRRLLPDLNPLRRSTLALLRTLDDGAQVTPGAEPTLTNVTLTQWQPVMLEALLDLHIGVLDLSQARMGNVRALAALDIRSLNLGGNNISDLSALRTLPVQTLQLDHTPVADIAPLAGMPLRELHLSHTFISSLLPLSLCPLHTLDLSATAIGNLEPLRGMELKELNLSRTRVGDISVLASMPLQRLSLNDTSVHDLQALRGAHLTSLSLANTPVKDIEVLSGMPLVELDLRGCELLSDLSPLAGCTHLERLHLPSHLKIPADHWHLSRLKFVDYDHHETSSGALVQK